MVLVDVDDTVKATYGYAKQGRPVRLQQGEGAECAAGHGVDADVGAGDRGDPVAERLDQLRPWRGPAGRRRPRDDETMRRDRSDPGPGPGMCSTCTRCYPWGGGCAGPGGGDPVLGGGMGDV
jgi:hypothetical protein